MGPRLSRLLPLFALAAALMGCGGSHLAPGEGLEATLREANSRSNDGTSIPKAHSNKWADPIAARA